MIFDCILIDTDTTGLGWREFVDGVKNLENQKLKTKIVAISSKDLSEENISLFDKFSKYYIIINNYCHIYFYSSF